MKLTLPAINLERKWPAAALWYAAFCVGYLTTGRFHRRAPMPLAPSFVDDLIPFQAWTVWIYLSQFALLFLGLLALKKTEHISRTIYSIALASGAAFLIFLISPTEFARPLPTGVGLTARAFAYLHALDAPTNCFPSLHVALAWLAALGVADEHRRLRAVGYAWAAGITLSTLTTKQHCMIDVVGGCVLMLVCRGLPSRATFRERRPSPQSL